MKTRLVAINGSGGAFTPISATQICRRVDIVEDASGAAGVAQGLAYQYDDGQVPAFTAIYEIAPANEPLRIGDSIAEGNAFGPVVGIPAQSSGGSSTPATLLCRLRSLTATGTVVRVTEWD